MIYQLTGILLLNQSSKIVLDVGGIGYEIYVSLHTSLQLTPLAEKFTIFTYLVFKENTAVLYGFSEEIEKQIFLELIKISGVGPKLALSILSRLSIDNLYTFVNTGNSLELSKIPGIGKKTAERLCVELRDKLPQGSHGIHIAIREDTIAALKALGYSLNESSVLLDAYYNGQSSAQELIHDILKKDKSSDRRR